MDDQDRQRLAAVQQGLAALTARLNALAEGHLELPAEGFRVGSTRLLEKLISGDYHLHQRDAAGVESDLTGAKSIWGKPIHDTVPTGGYVLVYNASTGEIEWTASSAPGAHVLATTAGLGPAHTTSGLTARQVLRATGAAAAAFGAIQDADLPASIARDSELHAQAHTVVSHSDTTATGAELETLTDGSETALHSHAGGGAPDAHAASHENDGGDEVDVGGLSGVLADDQPSDHATPIAAHAGDDDAHHEVFRPAEHTAIGDGAPHHTRYADAEADARIAIHAAVAAAHHAVFTATEHTAIGDGAPHHTKYTDGEADARVAAGITTHVGESDPHTGYQKESEKDAASGYAGLDATPKLTVAQIRGLRESGGQALDMGAVADGEYLKRDGAAIVGGTPAGGNGGATTALDNLAAVAINESLISDGDLADDLGSAALQWANAYVQKLWLNPTAAIDGATVGKVNLTGNLQTSGVIGIGTAPVAGTYLRIAPTGAIGGQRGIDISPAAASIGDGETFYALTGTAVISTVAPNVGLEMDGLFFAAVKGGTGDLTDMSGIRVAVGQMSSAGTITRMHVILVDTRWDSGGTPTIPDAWGIRIRNQGTDHVTRAYGLMIEPMVGAGSNYSIWAGATKDGTPRLRLDDGAPADYETMLYLGADDPITLQRVTLGAADSGDAGFRCLQVPNL